MKFMSRYFFAALCLCIGLRLGAQVQSQIYDGAQTGLRPLLWLAGTWMRADNNRVGETWQWNTDSLMTAQGFRLTAEGDTAITETIALEFQNGKLCYSPTVANQNAGKAIPFSLTHQDAESWTFENPSHDYPKLIRYELKGLDTLVVTLGGERRERDRKFYYLRADPPSRFELKGEGDTVTVMRRFWLMSYVAGPNRSHSKEEANQIQAGHMAHLNAVYKAGKSCVAGPTDGKGPIRGFVVYNTATREEAEYLSRKDPAVRAGRLQFTLDAWWMMEGAVMK
jgi:uncharacterized protein YciI